MTPVRLELRGAAHDVLARISRNGLQLEAIETEVLCTQDLEILLQISPLRAVVGPDDAPRRPAQVLAEVLLKLPAEATQPRKGRRRKADGELSEVERLALAAATLQPLPVKVLARLAGFEPGSHFAAAVTNLVRMGLLRRTADGVSRAE